MWEGHLGCITDAKHRVELLDNQKKPVHLVRYRTGPKTIEFEKAEIEKAVAWHKVEPTQTEYAAPIVFAPEKDESFRFCAGFEKLNAETKRDS